MTYTLTNVAYTVGWICTDDNDLTMACAMLDEEHGKPPSENRADDHSYVFGNIQHHNIVIASLEGVTRLDRVAKMMISSFPKIENFLLVGTGSGIPSEDVDIRLGDVAVSVPSGRFPGIVRFAGARPVPIGLLNKPSRILLNAVGAVFADHELGRSQLSEYLSKALNDTARPRQDRLFLPHSLHTTTSCKTCRGVKTRPRRRSDEPHIHLGNIAFGDREINDGQVRDLIGNAFGAICVEEKAASLEAFCTDRSSPLVIRGIRNYADAHSEGAEVWRWYASATGAAYAKELLTQVQQAR